MYFLFSSEGPTDLGTGLNDAISEGDQFLHGPLVLLADQIFRDSIYEYSFVDSQCFGYVSKSRIVEHFKTLKPLKKFRIPQGDLKDSQGTKYFRNNARALGAIAKKIALEKNDDVVAILFRDSDERNSSSSSDWKDKFDSMILGFRDEQFDRGVPMLPKPVSEAWILCAIYRKENPNRSCNDLEDRKYGTGAEHSLKIELTDLPNINNDRDSLNEKVENLEIHYSFINLNSFNAFKTQFEAAIQYKK